MGKRRRADLALMYAILLLLAGCGGRPVAGISDPTGGTRKTVPAAETASADAGRRQFIAAYAALLDTLRRDAPQAWFFCTLGPLTEESGRLFALIRELTDARRAAGDTRICALSFPAATAEEGLGTDDHPSRKTHERMALALTEEIRMRLCR